MALGDIGSVLDTLEFDTTSGQSPHMVQVSGDVYACAYNGPNNGTVCTFTVDSAGTIGNAVIDALEFDAAGCSYPRIRNISGDVFAIVYTEPGTNTTRLATVDIDSSGNIAVAVIDSLVISATGETWPSRLLSVGGDVYACAHTNPGNDGEIFTVDIDSSGNIGAAVIDTLAYSARGVTGDLINISGTTYAVAYQGPSSVGRVLTFSIADDGTLTGALDVLDFDATKCTYPRILNVSGDVYVIAYQGVDNDGFAKTMTIAADGTIGNSVIDTLEFEITNCLYVDMAFVARDVFVVSYYRANTTGNAKTFTVDSGGSFSAVIDTLAYESSSFGAWPTIILIANTSVACVVYQGVDTDGFAKTFLIDTAPPTVTTQAVTSILETTATGNGNVTDLGSDTVSQHGHCWATSTDPTTSDSKTENGAKGSTGAFTSSITGLSAGVTYFVRAYATNSIGTSYGDNVTFEAAIAPTVETQNSTDVTGTTATGNGYITGLGNFSVTAHGHCWDTSTNPTTSDSSVDNGAAASTGAFTSSITGLSAGTLYYARAFVTNVGGTGYGANVTFIASAPTVITLTCKDVEETTATGRGDILHLGGSSVTAHGHCWDTSSDPTTGDSSVDNGAASATGGFTSALTGLTPGTVYYTRAFAINSSGTSYGDNVRFTASLDRAGIIWMEGSNFRGFDENAIEGKYIRTADVDDTSVNGETEFPISSNWAYDHENDDGVHDATAINVSELSTATYDDVQDYINFFGDRTLLSGGAITDNGDGTAAIASLTGWCKVTDDDDAIGKFFDWDSPGNTPALTNMTTSYVYVDYNGGSLQLVVSTDVLTHGYKLDHILIATIYNHSDVLHWHQHHYLGIDRANVADMHHLEEHAFHRANGIVTSDETNRNLSVTAGVLFEGNDREATLAFDTSRSGQADLDEVNKLHDQDADFTTGDVGKAVHNTTDDTYGVISAFVNSGELTLAEDTFPDGNELFNIDWWSYWYYNFDGSVWVEVPGATQIDNTQYNLTTSGTGLATLSAAVKYGVHWVYMEADGQHFHVVYGQGNYFANEAEEAGVPSLLPNIVTNYCVLIAKIEVQKNTDSLIISYPWTAAFVSTLATDHGSLGGLTDDDHTQYIKDSEFTAADEVIVGTGSGTFNQVTLGASEFLAKKAAGAATNVTAAEAMAVLSGSAGADFSMNTNKITSVTDPGSDQDAATKKYVDDQVGGVNEFTELTDTPANYTGAAGKSVRVNATPDGLEFYDHEGAADPHAGYRLESADHSHQTTGAQAGKLDHGAALNGLGDDDHTQYIKHSLATVLHDFVVATGAGTFVKKNLAETIIILAHASAHGNGGVDEVSVTGLSGLLADDQHVIDAEVTAVAIARTIADANSVLYAVSDNTPAALAMAASTILGRKSTGDIVALTAAELLTIINVAAGADVTGNNAPQAHEGSHVSGGSDDIDSALAPIAIALTTRGDTVYQDASGLQRLAKGSSGDVLTMGADDPAWSAPAGGGVSFTELEGLEERAVASTGTWLDWDLSGIVPAGTQSVLVVCFDNHSSTTAAAGARKNGTSTARGFNPHSVGTRIAAGSGLIMLTEVDGSRIIEIYSSSTVVMHFGIKGYWS